MSPKTTLPLDIYVRVSKVGGRDGESFISPQVQEERCRALAFAKGYAVGNVLTDLDRSGGTMDRPGFNEALARIKAKKSGGIIVARLDRFARTLQGALNTLEEIEKAGGYLIECDGDWDTSTAMGRFGRDLVLRLAQLFREQVAESWDVTTDKMIERGVHSGGRLPAGYARGADGRLVVVEQHRAGVVAAFECRASGGSWTRVAAVLTEHGVPNRGSRTGDPVPGKPWAWTAATKLLANKVYRGEARYGTKVNVGAHEAIVSRELWEQVRARDGEKPAVRGDREGALLAKLLRCDVCSKALIYQSGSRGRGGFYRCREHQTIQATPVEALVERAALEFLGGLAYDEADDPTNAGETQRALEDAEAEVAAYVRLTPASAPGYAEGLAARQAVVNAAREALVESVSPRYRVYVSAAETARMYASMPVPTKREVLRACVARACVKPGRGGVDGRVTIELASVHPLADLPPLPESSPEAKKAQDNLMRYIASPKAA
jgi:DNA invertase Pin-like site-specific DNA recombinase